jgi:hypothetical protein
LFIKCSHSLTELFTALSCNIKSRDWNRCHAEGRKSERNYGKADGGRGFVAGDPHKTEMSKKEEEEEEFYSYFCVLVPMLGIPITDEVYENCNNL